MITDTLSLEAQPLFSCRVFGVVGMVVEEVGGEVGERVEVGGERCTVRWLGVIS